MQAASLLRTFVDDDARSIQDVGVPAANGHPKFELEKTLPTLELLFVGYTSSDVRICVLDAGGNSRFCAYAQPMWYKSIATVQNDRPCEARRD